MSFSSSLATGERREIGRCELPWSFGFPGLRMGMILPTFQMLGMISVLMDRFRRQVRYSVAFGPRCFNIMGAMLSGPNALEVFVVFRALLTSSVLNRSVSVLFFLCMRLRMLLLDLSLVGG